MTNNTIQIGEHVKLQSDPETTYVVDHIAANGEISGKELVNQTPGISAAKAANKPKEFTLEPARNLIRVETSSGDVGVSYTEPATEEPPHLKELESLRQQLAAAVQETQQLKEELAGIRVIKATAERERDKANKRADQAEAEAGKRSFAEINDLKAQVRDLSERLYGDENTSQPSETGLNFMTLIQKATGTTQIAQRDAEITELRNQGWRVTSQQYPKMSEDGFTRIVTLENPIKSAIRMPQFHAETDQLNQQILQAGNSAAEKVREQAAAHIQLGVSA